MASEAKLHSEVQHQPFLDRGRTADGSDDRRAVLRLNLRCASGWNGALPALLTPFPLYMDKENSHSLTTEEARHGFYLANEGEMGVIIDRLRIVHWCIEGLRNPKPSMNAAIEKLDDLFGWSNQAGSAIGLMT